MLISVHSVGEDLLHSVGEDLPGLALDHELHDVLGLLQLVKLVQLDLAHQHSAEDECLDVHLGLLLNLLS